MTLTEWWSALIADLERLKVIVKPETTNSSAWAAAMTMATEGQQIEKNLLAATGKEKNIKKASEKLGNPYTSAVTDEPQYLPNVTNPDELLLAMTFYQHLNRYSQINEGNSLVVNGVRAKNNVVQANMTELKSRIDAYLAQMENEAAIQQDFKDIADQEGATLFEKVQNFLSELPIVDKLIGQFEAEINDRLKQYHESINTGINDIANFFNALDKSLKEKEKTLREIAEYKNFIEQLSASDILLADLKKTKEMMQQFPLTAAKIMSLDTPDTERGWSASVVANSVRGAIWVGETVGALTRFLTSNTAGRIVPTGVNNMASSLMSNINGVKEAIKPLSNAETKKQSLIPKIQKQIDTLAEKLNYGDERKFKMRGKDFDNLSSAQINQLADKMAAIRYIVHIQKCLVLYEQKQATGIAKVTQSNLVQPIVRWLASTVFRRLMHDKVLLVTEAQQLEQKLDKMKEALDKNPSVNTTELTAELNRELERTSRKAEKIHKNSIYTLFSEEIKKESESATKDLKDVTALGLNSTMKSSGGG